MATARLAGKSVTQIAEDEGLSRQHTSAELGAPETQGIIARLVDRHIDQAGEIAPLLFTAIRDALQANKEYVAEGCPFDGGPDHYARMTAVTKFIDLMKVGRSQVKPAEEKDTRRTFTLEEIEAAVAAKAAQR